MKRLSILASVLPMFSLLLSLSLSGQTRESSPREYIESSSPLRGGGVVTSLQYSNQATIGSSQPYPTSVYRMAAQPMAQQNALKMPSPPSTSSVQPGQTVLYTWNRPTQGPPSATNFGPAPLYANPANTTVTVPTLGVTTPLRQALSGNRCTCTSQPSTVWSNSSVPVTAYSPTVGQPGFTTAPQTSIQFQNMPPSSYPGRGWLGQPKVYVDGQPMRNLLRYLIIP